MFTGRCIRCGRVLETTGETELCSACMMKDMVVGHGAVYPVDKTKMPEPVIVNRADFGEMLEAKQQARELGRREGREVGIREALEAVRGPILSAIDTLRYVRSYVEGRALSAEDDANEAIEDLTGALAKLRALLPEGEGGH